MSKIKVHTIDIYQDSTTGDKYQINPAGTYTQISTAGAGLVTTMPGGVVHIRETDALALAAAVTFDWSATPIKACELELSMEGQTNADMNSIAFCIDPPNAATRDSWLTAGTNLSTDTQRFTARVKDGKVQMSFTSAVSYIGIKHDLGADALRIVAAGVEA